MNIYQEELHKFTDHLEHFYGKEVVFAGRAAMIHLEGHLLAKMEFAGPALNKQDSFQISMINDTGIIDTLRLYFDDYKTEDTCSCKILMNDGWHGGSMTSSQIEKLKIDTINYIDMLRRTEI